MSLDFSSSYEAPISLDSERLIGTVGRRTALWSTLASFVVIPVVIANVLASIPQVAVELPEWFPSISMVILPFALIFGVTSLALAKPWGQRPMEYWLKAIIRHYKLPKTFTEDALRRYHVDIAVEDSTIVADYPRAVVEVETYNLKMTDAKTLGGKIKQLHQFYLGLRFPIQIVVRSWAKESTVERRWFVAVAAETDEVLKTRLQDVCDGLRRAGLGGRPLNGDLYDTLQVCWTAQPGGKLGPTAIRRHKKHIEVGGEFLRGLLLSKMPSIMEPNWLAPILDGELPVDFSMWLDPTNNSDEAQYLADLINDYETAQHAHFRTSGYRSVDKDDVIKDAQRTRLWLKRRWLRVFKGSVGFVVRGKTLAEMEERERLLADQLREQVGDHSIIPLDYEHDRAPLLAVPTGFPPIEFPLRIVSPAAALSYPFSNSCISMPGGSDCGVSLGSRRVNRLNLFQLANPHMVIPGTTGAGKGFWLKVWLWRVLHETDITVFIIQTEKDEYTHFAETLQAEGKVKSVVTQIDFADALQKHVYPQSGYRARGSLREQGPGLVVLDLTKMPSTEQGDAIAKLLHAIECSVSWVGKPRLALCAIDELAIVLRDKQAAEAIETAYRRFRSIPAWENAKVISRVGMIGLTQLPSDLLGHGNGAKLAKLAAAHLYLRQQPMELEVTRNVLKLSQDEVDFLESCDEGEALLVAGKQRVALKLEAQPLEYSFAIT